ncbi:MAG: hypothetical protein NVSMB29_00590 [Candidatus Dormibacteria bacterium]
MDEALDDSLASTAMEWTERASRGISEHRPTGSDLERTAEVAKAYALLAVARELRGIHDELSALREVAERRGPGSS